MATHPNRGRIALLPLDSTLARWRRANAERELHNHAGWTLIGLTEDGALIRHNLTGQYAIYRGGYRAPVDQRKAQAAVDARAD